MTNPFGQTTDDDYNPFAHYNENPDTNPYQLNSSGNANNSYTTYEQPVQSSVVTNSTPSYDYKSDNAGDAAKVVFKDPVTGVAVTEKDLIEKERALAMKEERISNREREIADSQANGTIDQLNPYKRNYPPLLNLYAYYPEKDIPEESRSLLQKVYWLEYGAIIALFLNVVGCFASLAIRDAVKSPASNIVFGCFYFIFGSYISMDFCVMTLYNSFKTGKSLKFVGFLVAYACFGLFMAFLAIGLTNYGSVGWLTAIRACSHNTFVAVYCFIYSVVITAYVCANGWLWYLAFRYFRTNDFKKRAIGEAAGMAAQFASEHKEEIASVVQNGQQYASQQATTV